MNLTELVERTAWQAGASEDEAGRVVEAFLHELRTAILKGELVSLGGFGLFAGTTFTPGRALRPESPVPLAETAGYDEGTAPSDS